MSLFVPEQWIADHRYQLLESVGRGTFGEVWQAKFALTDEVVALKILAPEGGLSATDRQEFKNEYLLFKDIRHLNLLRSDFYDEFTHEGQIFPFLKMAYCQGGNLRRWAAQQGGLGEADLARVLHDVAAGLAFLHDKCQLLHNDIKPDNILLGPRGEFLLADFGISTTVRQTLHRRTHAQLAHPTRRTERLGGEVAVSTNPSHQTWTAAYAPPELFGADPRRRPPSDVFSLGVTLFEAVAQTLPFQGAGGAALAQTAQPAPLLSGMFPGRISPHLAQLVAQCLAPDPTARPTAAHLCEQAAYYLEHGQWPGAAVKPPEAPATPVKSPARPVLPAWRQRAAAWAAQLRRSRKHQLILAALLVLPLLGWGGYRLAHWATRPARPPLVASDDAPATTAPKDERVLALEQQLNELIGNRDAELRREILEQFTPNARVKERGQNPTPVPAFTSALVLATPGTRLLITDWYPKSTDGKLVSIQVQLQPAADR
ncbi:MAG: serine/threonine protein kinase [Bernardetiaceae bacterium]|jgi:serine/threonine protein kinase|nr:serine/threonine protein kinase [Bernardetiaceae bacterium]